MSDLWYEQRREQREAVAPLAVRLRPRSLDEFVGQRHFLGEGKLLRRMIDAGGLTSVLFCGPPGTGKTSLAEIIAGCTDRHFVVAHAASIGVKEVREILREATSRVEADGRRTILFLDEIHRFARNQQDVLLDHVERGLITLIGATTENPYFSINSALVSRSTVFRFEPLSEDEVRTLLRRAIEDQRAFQGIELHVACEAIDHWARLCDGDARRALSALEVAVLSQARGGAANQPRIQIDLATAEESIQAKAIAYDGTGDEHYDVISAFIKSMRGSDPDAAVYWLAHMLEAGEDPRFIARRIAILASEDIGNADPRAIQVAASTWELVERIGLPECQLTLAQAAIYMAAAPKSNASARAIWDATKDVREGRSIPVPMHLGDGNSTARRNANSPENYRSPHDAADGYELQEYLGVQRTFYVPTDRGLEARIGEHLESLRRHIRGARSETTDSTSSDHV